MGEEQEAARKAAEKAYWEQKMADMSSGAAACGGRVDKHQSEEGEAAAEAEAAQTTVPKHTIGVGETEQELVVTVELPTVKKLKGFDIAVSDDGDELKVIGAGYELVLPLKREVDVDTVSAKFDKASRVLTIRAEQFEAIATSAMR